MSNPYTNSSEYGKLPEDYPVLREYDTPPVSEGLAEEYVDAAELQAPAPEITPPGSFVSEQPRSRRRIKKLMFAVAAACIMFVAFRPFGLFKGASVTPGAPETPAIPGYTETIPEPGGPSIGINYAFLEDDGQITFSYFVAAGELFIDPIEMKWASPVTVEIKAVDEEGHESVPPFSPDVWESSRSMFDYSVDASPLSGDMMLVLTGHYTFDGTEREIVATKNVVPRPPAPNTNAAAEISLDEETGVYTLDYKAEFDPQDGDDTVYDLEAWQFYMNWYDGDELVGSEGHVAYDDNGDVMPEMSPDGDGWAFAYSGIARLDYAPAGVRRFSVGLTLIDRNTAILYEIETPVMDIPVYEDGSLVTPVCDVYAYACWSEMYCDMEFSDMESATKVTLEIWDPNLDTLASSQDITDLLRAGLPAGSPIPDGTAFSADPFYTDTFVDNNGDYYADKPFPMEAQYHVVIDYGSGPAAQQVTYIADTVQEVGFHVKYVPDKFATGDYPDPYAGTIGISMENTEKYPKVYILVDQPELVTSPDHASISVFIDGRQIPESEIEFYRYDGQTFFGPDSNDPVDSHFETAFIRRPAGIAEGSGKTAEVYITHYLEAYGRVVTSKQIVEFTVDETW